MKYRLSIILIAASIASVAQTTYERTYGTPLLEQGNSVQITSNGGYILGGTNLVKVDSLGNEIWTRNHRSNHANTTYDGGYILIDGFGTSIYINKLDSNGNIVWQNVYAEGGWANEGEHIAQTRDGGFILNGRFQSVTGSGMLLLKLDSLGNKIWQRTYGESSAAGFNYGFSVQETADSGYVMAGYSKINYYDSTRHNDVFIVKTDSTGFLHWRRFFGGLQDDCAASIRQNNAGEYLIAGTTNSYDTANGPNMYVIKLNGQGDSLWTNTFGGPDDDQAFDLTATPDGGALVVGSTASFGAGGLDAYVLRLDQNGDTLWTKTYGGFNNDVAKSVQQSSDGGFSIAGYTDSYGFGDFDMWLLKTDSLGNVQSSLGFEEQSKVSIRLYPNPSAGLFTIESVKALKRIKIYNILGETVFSSTLNGIQASLDLRRHATGTYFYQVEFEDDTTVSSGSFVLQ